MSKSMVIICAGGATLLLQACTWVKPTPEGESVRVMTAEAVVGCERKGKVTVSLKDRVAGIERNAEKVAKELATLARNEGALLGGDSVVAESPEAGGRQTFGVYECRP